MKILVRINDQPSHQLVHHCAKQIGGQQGILGRERTFRIVADDRSTDPVMPSSVQTLDQMRELRQFVDIQITLDNPTTPIYDPVILNAGKAHSLGFEAEIDARVTKRLRVGGNLSVQKARFDEGTLPTGEPLHRLPLAPSYSAALSSEYRLPIGFGDLSFYGEALFRGNSYLGYTNSKAGQTGSYVLLNGKIALAGHDDRWQISVFGDNLTNKIVKTRVFDLTNSDLIGQAFIALSEPRTFGIRLRGRY